jgi:hypothetical protein
MPNCKRWNEMDSSNWVKEAEGSIVPGTTKPDPIQVLYLPSRLMGDISSKPSDPRKLI